MGYSEYDKYHEVLICPASKAVYIDGDGCPNYCLECEACKEMTKLDDLDPTLLIEAQAEICNDCADDFLEELAIYKRKYPVTVAVGEYPNREELGLGEFKAKDKLYIRTGMVMGDHKGRT